MGQGKLELLMEEPKEETQKKRGRPRKPQPEPEPQKPVFMQMETEPPVHIRVLMRGFKEAVEFGCSEWFVENGFYVFVYPSLRDRFRDTRREIAVSEIREIEITEVRRAARRQEPLPSIASLSTHIGPQPTPKGPVIHNAKENAMNRIRQQLEAQGPEKISALPGITFGDDVGTT